ncbi:MAG: diaminopimelate epimerase [Clostridia bacterium]|mgnify:CR=1 FL=1|nr:diaminopimelate epimerase [Clostridia bacterium]
MKFTKMHGCGNDYVYVESFTQKVPNRSDVVRFLSDRNFGIGGDGVIFINPSDQADCEMEMYNADGSRSEMCGNGIRCVAKFVYDHGFVHDTQISIISMGKIKYLTLYLTDEKVPGEGQDGKVVETVMVDMGEPEIQAERVPVISKNEQAIDEAIEVDGKAYQMTCVSMGNPHAVVFVDDVAGMDLLKVGPSFEHHRVFPNRVNTEFARIIDKKTIEMRVWERGTGETLACGTGACATAVAAILNGLTETEVTLKLRGGNLLISWDRIQNKVFMTGEAVTVFEGEIHI